MRRVVACLLAAGFAAAAGPAPAQGLAPTVRAHEMRHGFSGSYQDRLHVEHRRAFHRSHGLRHGRHGLQHHGHGLPLGLFPRAYVVGEPRATTFIETRERLVEPSEPTIPTSVGIRAAPVGQPTLYVLNEPPRRPGFSGSGRRGPQVVELDRVQGTTGEGPRVVHLRVPQDGPRSRR